MTHDVETGGFSLTQQLAILQNLPAAFKGSSNFVTWQKRAKRRRHTLIKQDPRHDLDGL